MNRLGIIGSVESISLIKDMDVIIQAELIFFSYENPLQSKEIVKSNSDGIDAFIFLGPIPYNICKNILEEKAIISNVIEFDHYVLSKSLFKIFQQKKVIGSRFSLDTFTQETANDVIKDLKLNSNNIYIHKNKGNFDIEKITDYHIKLWKEGKTDFILTGISSVFKKLKSEDIPCFKVEFSKYNYLITIDKLNLVTKYRKTQLQALIVGTIIVHTDDNRGTDMYYQHEKYFLDIYKSLLDVCARYDLTIYRINDNFKIIGTSGSLKNIVKMEELLTIINKHGREVNTELSMGFGSGETSLEAEKNSLEALSLFEINENKIYLVTNKDHIELMSSEKYEDFSYIFKNVDIKYSKNEKELFINYINYVGQTNLNVKDYVKFSQVSYRTGTRLFNRLVMDSILLESGKLENQLGRPPKLYTLRRN